MTSCLVYKVMGLTFQDRINTQLVFKIEIAQVVARRITKPLEHFLGSNLDHWLLFFIHFFKFFLEGGGGRSDFIILFMSYFFSFYLFFLLFFFKFFIPLTCMRYIYKNFCNNTSYSKFGNTREYER